MGEEIKVTYELLFDLLRREKEREELQHLDSDFFSNVKSYLKDKRKILEQQTSLDLFSRGEKEKTIIQLQNVRKIIRDLYDRREKKIINMALNKARVGSSLVDLSALLPDEQELFSQLVKLLEGNRDNMLLKTIDFEKNKEDEEEKSQEQPKELKIEPNLAVQDKTKVKFLLAVGQFTGLDLEKFGPYEQGQETELPTELAELLIKQNKAEKV